MKGAPDKLWAKCSTILIDGQILPFTEEYRKKVSEANAYFGKNGQRVLAFTMQKLNKQQFPKGHKFNVKGPYETGLGEDTYTFIGLISLIDPPRDAVPGAIEKCKTAGIKVIMVTGDH